MAQIRRGWRVFSSGNKSEATEKSAETRAAPDLDHAKRTVLSSLGSPASVRAYEFAINDFISWYCSEPRLAFSKHIVLRYRIELESRSLSASLKITGPNLLGPKYQRKRSEIKQFGRLFST
jgi:hypothetical protein